MTDLGKFEGFEVLGTTIAVTNAGDGLSQAMRVDPTELHLGDTVYVVLECEVGKIRFEPVDKTEGVQRVQILKAGTATIIDAAVVVDAIGAQRERIERAKEAEKGVQRMEFDLADEHDRGEHELISPVPNCPHCNPDSVVSDLDTKRKGGKKKTEESTE